MSLNLLNVPFYCWRRFRLVPKVLFLMLVLLILSGCAQSKSVFRYQHIAPTKVFPAAPEVPRFEYVGQLLGEQNFANVDTEISVAKKIFNWVVGFVADEARISELQRPQSGLIDASGRIVVTDVSRAAVYVFDRQGGGLKVWDMAAKNVRFIAPIGIVSTAVGEFYVADAELGWVAKLGIDGKPVGRISHESLIRPTGLTRDPGSGEIYVSDTRSHDIKVFNKKGRLDRVIGQVGTEVGHLNAPTHLAFKDGKLYVTDTLNSRIQIFSKSGKFLKSIGKRGLFIGNMPRPKGIAVDNFNNIYVVESYYDYLLVFNQQGDFMLPIGGTGSGVGQFYLPAGVWTDKKNHIYVADAFNGRVMVFRYMGGV